MIGFCIGIVVIAFMPVLPAVWILACGAVLATYLIVTNRNYLFLNFLYVNAMSRNGALILLGFCYAGLLGQWNLSHRMDLDSPPIDLVVSGEVVGLPKQSPGRVQFLLRVESVQSDVSELAGLRKIRLSWYRAEYQIEPGQRWSFSVRLKPSVGLSNPGAFDLTGWLFQQGIDARGYILSKPAPIRLVDNLFSFDRVRYSALVGLQDMGLSPRSAATLMALLLGDKSALSQSEWELLQQSGTVHLVVISGLHIGIVCLLGYLVAALLQRIVLRLMPEVTDLRGLRALLAMGAGVTYAALAGFSIPTQRALIMVCALLLPALLAREKQPLLTLWQRWWLALMLVLIMQPLSVLQPGLWLSFTAVAVLFCATSAVFAQRWSDKLRGIIYSQWLIFIGLSPWLLFYTGKMALWAPLINLFAIPFLTFILLPCIMLLLLVGFFWPWFATPLLDSLIDLFWSGLQAVVGRGEGVITADVGLGVVMLAICGALLIALPRLLVFRWLGLFMFLPLLHETQTNVPDGQFRAWIFDVGQGLSVLIETQNHTVLYDTGAGFRNGGSIARYTLLPALQSFSVATLDRLIVSHSDNDHSGGYSDIKQTVEIKSLHSGSPLWRARFGGEPCVSGDSWQFDGVRFSYIQPQHPAINNENNRSCVLLVESTGCSLLIPGDVDSAIEDQIQQQYPGLKLNWLVAAHHGSRYSTTLSWLLKVHPGEVFFSAGKNNQYGHPAPEVIARVEAVSGQWKSTVKDGAIMLRQLDSECVSESYREQKKRYWSGS